MKLTFSAHVTAANAESRTVTGQIVPFGIPGNTSAGPVVFEPQAFGSIQPESVKLLLEHDARRPIGRMTSYEVTPAGITATFKVAETTAGSDALIEASDKLRDGFSVGAMIDQHTVKDGVIRVSAATLIETSLVTDPAYGADSRVSKVAASEHADDNPTPETVEETEMTETPIEKTDDVVEVEASKVEASIHQAPIFTAPRSPITTGAAYLEHSIKAARGNDESRQFVMAADDSFSTNPAFNPTDYLNEVIGTAQRKFGRPTIEACGGATAHRFIGNTISIPKVGTAPTVASTSEGGAPSETGMTSSYLTGTAVKQAGLQRLSVELLDLQGSPTFYNELMAELAAAYAKATNAQVVAAIVAGGTAATAQTADADGIQAFVAKESPAVFAGTGNFANAYVAGAGQWELMLGAQDSTGRAIFNAYQPQNSSGNVSPGSARGSVYGLDLFVDNAMVATNIDESAFIVAPDSIGIYEQAPRMLQVNQLGSLEVEVSIHGYLATIIKRAAGLRRFNIA